MAGFAAGRRAVRSALPLLALVCGLAVLTLPASAARTDATQPLVIQIGENVSSTDGPAVTPPAVTPPPSAGSDDTVRVADLVTVTPPPSVSDDESVGVSDSVTVVPPPVVSDGESVAVTDAVSVVPPANAGTAESASVSDSVSVVPLALATTTTLSAGPNPALAGAPVQLQAAVTAATHTVGSGTVTFEEGSTPLGPPVQVDASGVAALTVSSLSLGTHTIKAAYSGTPVFLASNATASEGIYDFSLSAGPDRTVLRGGTASCDLTLSLAAGSATSGLPASVPLLIAMLPGGASSDAPASIAFPQSVGGPTRLTVSVHTGAFELGDFLLFFAAGSRSVNAGLHVYDYSLALTPVTQTAARGATATFTLSSSLAPGSSTTGLPSSLALSTSPGSVVGLLSLPGSTSLTVTTNAGTPDGPQTVSVSADPGARTASATLYVDVPPTLHLPGAQSVDYHDALSFGVSATDPDAGDTVTLSASGLPAGLTFTDHGDRTGAVSGTDTAVPGPYLVTFTANDGHNAPVTGTVTITVQREQSTLTYAAASLSGSTATLSALLREDGTAPIAGRQVTFTVGARSCSATTNAAGTASCAISLAGLGSGPISATFAGDVDYLPSSMLANLVPGNLSCINQSFTGIVLGNLTVPPGAWCDLVNSTVSGNVHLNQATGGRIQGSVVQGNLEAGGTTATADPFSPGVNQICASTIGGNLHVHNSTAAAPWNIGSCAANTVDGNLQCDNNAALTSSGNVVQGNIEGQCAGSRTQVSR